MAGYMDFALEGMEADFRGKSWNGRSLMATLDALSAREAASTATWEGYSAWSVALHCAKCKRIVAADLGVPVPEWQHPEPLWFPIPPDTSEAAWARDRAMLAELHDASMKGLRALPESRLAEAAATWEAPWGRVIAWLATHDAFHGAQIRSMGLPTLKAKKHD